MSSILDTVLRAVLLNLSAVAESSSGMLGSKVECEYHFSLLWGDAFVRDSHMDLCRQVNELVVQNEYGRVKDCTDHVLIDSESSKPLGVPQLDLGFVEAIEIE